MAPTAVESIVPAASPPPGQHSNFENPHSMATTVYTVMSVCLGLVTLLVAMRMYTRVLINRTLWWDDWSSLLAWVFFIAFLGVTFGTVENGGGVDIWNVPKDTYRGFIKYWNYVMILARVDITLAKIAILMLYLRVFVPHITGSRQMWFWIWAMIVFNVLYCLVLILLIQLQCVGKKTPQSNGSCLDQHLLLIVSSVINVITELAILAVAVVAVWGLRMPLAKKIAIVAVLSFGSAGIAFSLARLIWQSLTHNTNPTVYNMTVVMLAAAETTVAIMAGCMPLLSSFYRYHFHKKPASVSSARSLTRAAGSGDGDGEQDESAQKPKKKKKVRNPLSLSTTELMGVEREAEEEEEEREFGRLVRNEVRFKRKPKP